MTGPMCIVIFLLLGFESFVVGKHCDIHSVVDVTCTQNETCSPSGVCECKIGYIRQNEICEEAAQHTPTPLPSRQGSSKAPAVKEEKSHLAAQIFIPLALIMIVICGFFANRRYRLINRLKNKFYQRNTNYDEVMIGQDLDDDDPPLH